LFPAVLFGVARFCTFASLGRLVVVFVSCSWDHRPSMESLADFTSWMERDVRSREAVGDVEVPESGEGGGGSELGEEWREAG